jgi:hypothetical protein
LEENGVVEFLVIRGWRIGDFGCVFHDANEDAGTGDRRVVGEEVVNVKVLGLDVTPKDGKLVETGDHVVVG